MPALPARTGATRGIRSELLVREHESTDFLEQRFEEIRQLGKGSFASVSLVRERSSGQLRVAKVMHTAQMNPYVLDLVRREVQLMAALDHPRIARLYEHGEDPQQGRIVLIMEYVPGGTCEELLFAKDLVLDEAQVARLVHQALTALAYLHSRGIVHRDLKPENMMCGQGAPDCKIIDFGMATRARDHPCEVLGTVPFMAPEALPGPQPHLTAAPYGTAVDIWSLGASAALLLSGVAPFGKPDDYGGNPQPVFDRIGSYHSFGQLISGSLAASPGWRGRSPEAADFLRQALTADPAQRPRASRLLEHRWLVRHRAPAVTLTGEALRGLACFVEASPPARFCAAVVVARGGAQDLGRGRLGAMFAGADRDGDGRLARGDLEAALAHAVATSAWWNREVQVGDVLAAAGSERGLSFMDFLAAVLLAREGSVDRLARAAFAALDDDGDGLLSVEDLRLLLGGADGALPQLAALPQQRGFSVREWCTCLQGPRQPPRQKSFLDMFLCSGQPRTLDDDDHEFSSYSDLSPCATPVVRGISCH